MRTLLTGVSWVRTELEWRRERSRSLSLPLLSMRLGDLSLRLSSTARPGDFSRSRGRPEICPSGTPCGPRGSGEGCWARGAAAPPGLRDPRPGFWKCARCRWAARACLGCCEDLGKCMMLWLHTRWFIRFVNMKYWWSNKQLKATCVWFYHE